MNKKEMLYEALTEVKPEYVGQANEFTFTNTGSKRPLRWAAAAAAACLVLGTAAFGIARAFSGNAGPESADPKPDEPTVQETFSPAETVAADELAMKETYSAWPAVLQVIYDRLSEITEDADCIALVDILGRSIEASGEYGGCMTHTRIRLREVYKGEETPGIEVEVIEFGGRDDEHLLGDYPQLSENSQYVLFMHHTEGNYYICGAFQGRFILREGLVAQQRLEDIGVVDYTPVPLDGFKKLIGG